MNQFEYVNERLQLSTDEAAIVNLGVTPDAMIDALNSRIIEVINRKGKEGWEVLYPFSVPVLWFKRTKQKKKIDTRRKR